jgi:hypothetical protein
MYEDRDYDDDIQFADEVNVFSRVGVEGLLGSGQFLQRDVQQRFHVYVDATARMLKQRDVVMLSEPEIQGLLGKLKDVPNPRYKNPIGFVLGYYITLRGNIDVKRFGMVKKNLRNIDYPGGAEIRESDVLRYCNLWIEQLW